MPSRRARRTSPRYDQWPAPPPRNQNNNYRPSSPRRPPPDMYHFRGNASRESDHHNNDFNFSRPGPRFEPQGRNNNAPARQRSPPRGPKRDNRRNGQRFDHGRRGGWQKRGPSDRNILHSKRDTTPERLEGMENGTSFKAFEDLSDSEAEMELSDEEGAENGGGDGDNSDGEIRPVKKTRTGLSTASEAPKWSNPDPYTCLPPPDESQTKKKDMVKLIRKAKMAAEADASSQNAAAQNVDFISFNFDEDGEADAISIGDSRASSVVEVRTGSVRTASGFSHLDNLHPDRKQPPSRPLSERIEKPRPMHDAGESIHISLPTSKRGSGNKGLDAPQGDSNAWPPPTASAAVAGSKRRLDLDVDDHPPGIEGSLPQTGPLHGKKRKRPLKIFGAITDDWQAMSGDDRMPWCTTDHSASESVGMWLHKEIRDFHDYIRPYNFEAEVRKSLISRLSKALDEMYRGGHLFSFGSFEAGIYLPTADLDLVFVSESYRRGGYPHFGTNRKWMWRTMDHLVRRGVAKKGGEVIWGAKVPILKLTDPLTDLRVDISFENMTGVVANQTFQDWKVEYAAMPILVTVIKQFLLMRGLNEVHTGGIGGFTVTCLVTSLLQHLPAVQSGEMQAEEHLGEILMEFLDLYGNKFNYIKTGIQMLPPGYFPKPADAKPDRLKIIDPNNPNNDISGGSHKVAAVFEAFKDAYQALQQRMNTLEKSSKNEKRGASILSSILGGNYTLFRHQRDHMKRLWDSFDSQLYPRDGLRLEPPPYVPCTRMPSTPYDASLEVPLFARTSGILQRVTRGMESVMHGATAMLGHLDLARPRFAHRSSLVLPTEARPSIINREKPGATVEDPLFIE